MQWISFFRRHFLYSVIILLLSFVSCETELPEGTWSKEPTAPSETYQLCVNKNTIIVGAEGSSETISITSDDSWTVSASETWIKVSDTTGAGDKTITVIIEVNIGKEARSGTITVMGKSCGTKNISVSQSGMEYSLTVDKTEISVGAAETSEIISIMCNDSWTAMSDVNWVVLSVYSGRGDNTFTVSVRVNSTTEKRTGTITFMGSNSGIIRTISITQQGKSPLDTNGHEYVDLGLPSGLLWATCNIGASKPEEYGDYFAWGETTTKSIYDSSSYKYCKDSDGTLTKYCTDSRYGIVDYTAVLDLEDDAAHVNWGSKWRMPTSEELDELRDSNNCTWTWTIQNGVNGYRVTSKKSNESLFLPAAGDCYNYFDAGGSYWSSSLCVSYPCNAHYLSFGSGFVGWYDFSRCVGHSVRPVYESIDNP